MNSKQTPEDRREQLRQKELRKNPTGSLNEGLNGGNLADLVGGMGWKGTSILIIILIVGFIIYSLFFR